MKINFKFKSIYAKFTVIFLSIWWFLNFLTFGAIIHVISKYNFPRLSSHLGEVSKVLHKVKILTGITFLISACIGTIIILLVVRGIVKPIRQLSKASKEVAKGNFEVTVRTKSVDEIGQLTDDFNIMVKELKSIDLLRKEFVSNVSHEFRTPITSIKGFAKLIAEEKFTNEKLTEEQRFEYSTIIVEESERLMNLSTNLLRLSELDSKVIREGVSDFLLDEQIRKTILLLEPHWTKKNIEFDLEMEKINYCGNESLLQQVWINLIQNAIKFSNIDGLIKIEVRNWNGGVKVIIRDHGKGIAEIDKNRIFDRFYKGDRARSKDGNGLGLVIAKKIITMSGGKISFESEINKGTKFMVELPN